MKNLTVTIILMLLPSIVNAENQDQYRSQYIGQEERDIKSLSAEDLEQLKSGKGWGLAKVAELNGMPGPIHILQMKDKISLTARQERSIRALYEKMKSEAIPLGEEIIRLERHLNDAFANKNVDDASLKNRLLRISSVTAELRYVHLKAHLDTPAILTPRQLSLYNELRGYSGNNPCEHVPEGHDEKMWRKHNECE
jgi:Spy/CpxP family protein refolding chaperone